MVDYDSLGTRDEYERAERREDRLIVMLAEARSECERLRRLLMVARGALLRISIAADAHRQSDPDTTTAKPSPA